MKEVRLVTTGRCERLAMAASLQRSCPGPPAPNTPMRLPKIFSQGELRELAATSAEAKLFRSEGGQAWANVVVKDHSPARVAESHDHEMDIYVVLEGEADLHLGGTI